MSKHEQPTSKVIVIGGGIAGLATAFLMRENAREQGRTVDITVLEAKNRIGGSTRTDHINGYVCEWGPNGFLDNEPATLDLVRRAGLESELQRADDSSANRYIYHGGAMRKVPVTPPAFLISDLLPFPAKLRMGMEFFLPAKRDGEDESVDDFGRRRLGAKFADILLDPMVSGIFAGNTKELSLAAVFPKMVAMEKEYGGLFKAMIAKQRAAKRTGMASGGPAGPKATLHTFKKGMGRLPDRLAELLGDVVQVNRHVTTVRALPGGGFRVIAESTYWDADSVVLACPSHEAALLIRGLDPEAARALAEIRHAPVDVVCHGHDESHLSDPLRGFGVLIPRSEGIRSLGTLWSDAIFPGQAPKGKRLLRTILGGAHDPAISSLGEAGLHGTAIRDNRLVMGVRGEPELKWTARHERGIAQYTIGHLDRVAKADALERLLPGLYFTGASYRGVSINGCAKDAALVAKRVLASETAFRAEAA